MLEFSVLGPVEVRRDGAALGLGGSQQRRLMAVLLTNPGQVVSLDRLEEAVWPNGDAPEGSRRAVMTYISRLRSVLGNRCIATHGPGYQLEPGDQIIDAVVFERLLTAARQTAPTLRVATLDQALSMWRGSAFGEFADEWWARPTASRLEELRLAAIEDRVEALLETGDAEQVVSDLEGFVAAYPLRERPVGQLIRALSATGRRAEALRAFQDFRERLAEQTGLDPSLALVELERQISLGIVPESPRADRVARGYVLGDVLGEGSFGTVFRATQPGVGREVAVKVIRAERADNADFVHRFETEAQLVARLEHPHIVPLYDFWREPGGAYLVFRLMRGGNAEQALLTDGAWPLERVSRLVDEIGGALGVAHAAGVIHRDVKPANILFDEIGNAHLSDFGIALTDAAQQDGTSYSAGSPLYASPEQFLRQPVSAKSDLYSFAAMLWELLTGVSPFEGVSASVVERIKLERPVPSLRPWRPELAGVIDAVLQRATAVNPQERYASIHDLMLAWRVAAEHLRSASTGDPLAAKNGPRVAATMLEFATAGANPYKGLRAFGEADAREYFGRSSLIEGLCRLVNTSRVVAVVGPSGSGKSSLLHAGLLPRLREQRARVVTMMPTDRPSAQLRTALLAVATRPLSRDIDDAVTEVAREAESELVVLIDQFEELWTLATDVDERDRFVELLSSVAGDPSCNVRMVFAIRADFLDRPLADPLLGPRLTTSVFTVAPMTAAELSEAVRAPANAVGVSFEPGLDAEIVADVASQSASLPLLQFALAELYERRSATLIPTVAYREMGGVAGAIAARAEAVFAGLDAHGQREARRLFSRLVTPGAGAEDTRRRARRSEMPESANAIADQFVTHRLLVVDRDPTSREPTIDIAHEALLTRWPRLRSWLDEDREQLQLMQHLSRAADEWDAAGRRDTDLYRGPRLSLMGEINNTGTVILAPAEEEFLDASWSARAAEERQEQQRIAQQAKQNRRLRLALSGAAVALVIALVAGGVAFAQRRTAESQRDQANSARDEADIARLVAQSRADARSDPTRAMLLAVEAYKREPGWKTAGAVQSVLVQQPKGVISYLSGSGPFSSVEYGPSVIVARDGTSMAVWSATDYRRLRTIKDDGTVDGAITLSGDDRLVAVAGTGGLYVYDVSSGTQLKKLSYPSVATVAAFDPTDPERLAVGHIDGAVEIIWWRSEQVDLRLASHSARVESVSFSSIGGAVASSSVDTKARVFDARTGAIRAAVQFEPGEQFVTQLSPSGNYLVGFGRRPDRVRVWRVADAAVHFEWFNPSAGTAVLSSAQIVDDTTLFVTGLAMGVRRFDLRSKTEVPIPFLVGTSLYNDTAASPDGRAVAIAANTGITIQALDGRQLGAAQSIDLPPTTQIVSDTSSFSFDADGTHLLAHYGQSYLYDLTADPPTYRLLDFPGGVPQRARFAADGTLIETLHASSTGATYQRWDPKTLQPVGGAVKLPGSVRDFASSLDGRYVAAGNALDRLVPTSIVRIFDVQTGALVYTFDDLDRLRAPRFPGTSGVVTHIAFSDDSSYVAAIEIDALVVWDLTTGKPIPFEPRFMRFLDFDSKGRLLTVNSNGEILLRDVKTGKTVRSMNGRSNAGNFPAINPDPTRNLVKTDNSCPADPQGFPAQTQLWDLEAGVEIGVGFPFTCTSWSPNGELFAGNYATSVYVWSIDQAKWAETACGAAGRNLTELEWRTYVSKTELRRDTCP
ncbi:MAG: BTAD domain-containing putative transcriptional regulator [Acidimicrobiales bacterium]